MYTYMGTAMGNSTRFRPRKAIDEGLKWSIQIIALGEKSISQILLHLSRRSSTGTLKNVPAPPLCFFLHKQHFFIFFTLFRLFKTINYKILFIFAQNNFTKRDLLTTKEILFIKMDL